MRIYVFYTDSSSSMDQLWLCNDADKYLPRRFVHRIVCTIMLAILKLKIYLCVGVNEGGGRGGKLDG